MRSRWRNACSGWRAIFRRRRGLRLRATQRPPGSPRENLAPRRSPSWASPHRSSTCSVRIRPQSLEDQPASICVAMKADKLAGARVATQAPEYVRRIAPYVPGKPIDELAREYGLAADAIIK